MLNEMGEEEHKRLKQTIKNRREKRIEGHKSRSDKKFLDDQQESEADSPLWIECHCVALDV